MIRIYLLMVFSLISLYVFSQSVDSALITKNVDSLIQVSRSLTENDDFIEALKVNEIAEKLVLEKFGEESKLYGSCCYNRGRVNYKKEDYLEAENWYLKAKLIWKNTIGSMHPDYLKNLTNLANCYYFMGNFGKAEPIYLEVKETFENKLLQNEHPVYLSCIFNLANLYSDLAIYAKAEPLYIAVKSVDEIKFGKISSEYAQDLNNLGTIYLQMGEYEKAETSLLESIEIKEKIFGKDAPEYGLGLDNLATYYKAIGNNLKAEQLYLESIRIDKTVFGKENPSYASGLNNLADLYSIMGNFEKAELLFLEAIQIRKKILGNLHPDYATGLNNLAALYGKMKKNEKVEPLLLESMAIIEKSYDKQHPYFALSLINMASLYANIGNFKMALSYYLEVKTILESTLGNEHPYYSLVLSCIANLYKDLGEYVNAEQYYINAAKLNCIHISSALKYLSEKEMDQFLVTFLNDQHRILSFNQVYTSNSDIVQRCFDNALFYKGILLNSAIKLKQLVGKDSVTFEEFNLLKFYRSILASEYSKPISKRSSIIEIEEKTNKLEKGLMQNVSGFEDVLKQVNYQDVYNKLKQHEIAIEFVHYNFVGKQETDSIMYAALILKPGVLKPQCISLFEQKSLDSILQSNAVHKADYVNNLYSIANRGAIAIETPKKTLYEILWKPLEKELAGVSTIYYSPSGLIHRINLNAIPISDTGTLADKYELIELGSTRQLVIPIKAKIVNNDAILFGGILYEKDSSIQRNEQIVVSRTKEEKSFNKDTILRGGSWTYLPYSEIEVNSVGEIMKNSGINVKLKKGYEATEESFKSIGGKLHPSPKILHIATHGYFFPDPNIYLSFTENKDDLVFKISNNPMFRSGLILAGGNTSWQEKQGLEGREDGILNAYEISQMDLSNTELVVLSACETGLGEIKGNEGIYGLQRAFKIAGAKYLIMSLWQIPDKQTSLLMQTFYKKWLNEMMPIPKAFLAAQKELRNAGLDPYQWAGFILCE